MRVFDALLNRTFTVSRLERVSDSQGGWSEQWSDVGTVRGRLRPMDATERMVAAQEQAQVTSVLYVRAGADICRGDRVTGAGRVLDVVATREPSHAGHHLEIECQERQ